MNESDEAPKAFLTIDETIAAIDRRFAVRLCAKTVKEYAASGILSAVRIGPVLRISAASLAEYLASPPPSRQQPRKSRQPATASQPRQAPRAPAGAGAGGPRA